MPIISDVPRTRRNRLALGAVYLLATLWLIAMLFPLYYTILIATGDRAATTEIPPRLDIRLAKVAVISLDLTSFVRERSDLSRAQLESAIKGEFAVAATRPLFLNRELTAAHVIASVDGQVIAEADIPEWLLRRQYTQWLNQGPTRPRADGEAFFSSFQVRFHPEVLDGGVTRPAPTFARPAPSSLAGRVQNALADEGEVKGEWTLKIVGSVNHMFDGLRRAIGPKAVWGDLSQGSVPRWFLNSLIYAFGVIICQLIVSSMAGYALSRLWPRRIAYALELFFLATLMLPAFLLFLPLFLMMRHFPLPTIPFTGIQLPGTNLAGTYWALILPHTAWAFSILLFRGFFDQLPDELFQAARIDGASELNIFARIVFPLSRPVYATLVIFTFMAIWSEFAWPYMVAGNKQQMWTLSVGLFSSAGGAGTSADAQRSMSMALISAIPPLFIFAFFQRYLVRGIALTGIKG